jgi:hypothetical protein
MGCSPALSSMCHGGPAVGRVLPSEPDQIDALPNVSRWLPSGSIYSDAELLSRNRKVEVPSRDLSAPLRYGCMSTLGGSIVEQRAHVLGGGAVGFADAVHVAARHGEAAVPHPLPHRTGLGDGAELRGHEVPQPVQRVAVAELAHQRGEPLAHRVRPHRCPAVRRPCDHVRLGGQPTVELLGKSLAAGPITAKQLGRGRVQRQ